MKLGEYTHDDQIGISRSVYIKTYGCQMNTYDSQKVADMLVALGYRIVDDVSDAYVIFINTCNVRDKASEKLYSELGRLRKRGSKAITVVAGCVAQAEGDEVFRRAPNVDVVVGPQSIHKLPELLDNFERDSSRQLSLDFVGSEKFESLPISQVTKMVSANLAIQEGCDKFCHFCCVPYTRGAEYSRPVAEILAEASALVQDGAKELVLLGQNVNAYRGYHGEQTVSLGWLLQHLASAVPGIKRLRYTSSHPLDMHDELYYAHANVPQVMPFLHLPVQSGSDRMLAKMNRKHTAAYYIEAIDRMRLLVPDIQISSDFIVGYPGETEEDFLDTMRLVEKISFAQAYSFKYSPRPGTPAALREEKESVPDSVKSSRLSALQGLLNKQQHEINLSMQGKSTKVLIERSDGSKGVGRTPYMQLTYVEGSAHLVGQEVDVIITKALGHSLLAECEQKDA